MRTNINTEKTSTEMLDDFELRCAQEAKDAQYSRAIQALLELHKWAANCPIELHERIERILHEAGVNG